ncbi:hypothetical protein IFT48_04655 [Pseudomonas fluorescens]|uniref:hypothetical protein n=1 Tax=Pseudomonas TaxID=286 RepID=UPI000F016505|nr:MULTISPECIES: hypothetical protein [Pseudomonas]MBD8089264.1 hypothetical protein [Pseudomonas fluorescens]MBD8615309.1 hypothetical protein [Pseudomonas putida]MBD8682037.1 hypothetical protein [Pseudomonas sp. CFBP 13719]
MSFDKEEIAIHQIEDIRLAFSAAMSRLNLGNYKVDVDNDKHPIDVVTHPAVLLSRLAMRAEETSILLIGVRLFPNACYTVSRSSPCGMIIQHFDELTFDQQTDRNIQDSQDFPAASMANMTHGLMGLILESAIADTFEIDQQNKLVRIKPQNMVIHGLFRSSAEYEDGQGLPLLDAAMVAISDLHGMLLEEAPLKALNKAREKAAELQQQQRQRLAREQSVEGGIDGF